MTGSAIEPPASERVRVRRHADRGRYDRATIEAIVDEGLVAHVGVSTPHGPLVLPMAYGRIADTLYLHGAAGNGLLRTAAGQQVAVTITLTDGLVLARSAFHHSMNYRCVVVRGAARLVDDPVEKAAAFDAIVDHASPGRSAAARPASPAELRATAVMAVSLAEASAKVRAHGVVDEPEDLHLPVWAGVVPLSLVRGSPVADDTIPPPGT